MAKIVHFSHFSHPQGRPPQKLKIKIFSLVQWAPF
jgi:hypothetical protein